MSQALKLQYFFDPLCGWCYASAPALSALAARYPQALELLPSGLFAGSGARPLTAEWAAHARRNDQRIAQLTGQQFSEAYSALMLQGNDVRFDSTYMNLALTAMQALAPTLESPLLHALQLARYVAGRDTSQALVVAEVAATVAAGGGLPFDQAQFASRLMSDASLVQASAQRIAATQTLMSERAVSGVPLLWLSSDSVEQALHGSLLYQGGSALIAAIEALLQPQAVNPQPFVA